MKQISDCETYFYGITLTFLPVNFKQLPLGVNVDSLRVVQSWLLISADSVALTLCGSTFVTASCKFCQDDTAVVVIVCGRRTFSFVVSGRDVHLRLRSTCFEVRSLMGIMRKKGLRMCLVRQNGAYYETDVSSLNLAHKTWLRYALNWLSNLSQCMLIF